jgi:hypothetical protein
LLLSSHCHITDSDVAPGVFPFHRCSRHLLLVVVTVRYWVVVAIVGDVTSLLWLWLSTLGGSEDDGWWWKGKNIVFVW